MKSNPTARHKARAARKLLGALLTVALTGLPAFTQNEGVAPPPPPPVPATPEVSVPSMPATPPAAPRSLPPGIVRRSRVPAPAAAPAAAPDAGIATEEAAAPGAAAAAGAGDPGGEALRLKFDNAPAMMLLEEYSDKTGRTLLMSPTVPQANITLRSQGDLTLQEYLDAIEAVLAMNKIALLPEGEKFLRVVPSQEARQEPMPIFDKLPEQPHEDNGKLISQMIPVDYMELDEAKAAIEPLRHPYGQVHVLERTRSLMVTDTAANLNRILQVVRLMDQPLPAREKYQVYQIQFAKASDIKKKIEEIIQQFLDEQQKKSTVPRQRESGAPGVDAGAGAAAPVPAAGVIRARRPAAPGAAPGTPAEATAAVVGDAERGLIRGKIMMVADDRTNKLIVITPPENLDFLEEVIKQLDVTTSPDVVVRVRRLEYAEAKTVAGMLNDLIGAQTKQDDAKTTATTPAQPGRTGETPAAPAPAPVRTITAGQVGGERASKIGELSKDNVKILSDERTNSLILMASKSDMDTLEAIIKDMDMLLSQVMVEAVILQVRMDDSLETGVDWIQRSMIAYEQDASKRTPIVGFAGSGGGGNLAPQDSLSFTTPDKFPATPLAGLTYYLTYFDLNVDVVLRAAATDSRTKVLSSPVILTSDNKEATIDVATEQYFYKGKKYTGTTGDNPIYEDDVEARRVGITLKVTPRINQKGFVVMEISQTIDNVSGSQEINGELWPVVTSRKLDASVNVQSGQTIVLGGLMINGDSRSRSKVPILGDIPILGLAFNSKRNEESKDEVIVFITPYVLDTPEAVREDAMRRRGATHSEGMWQRGWSNSEMAEEPKKKPVAKPLLSQERIGKRGDAVRAAPAAKPAPAARPAPAPGDVQTAPVVPAPAPTLPAAVPRPEAPVTVAPEPDPLEGMDPETRKFVEREIRRYEKPLRRADRRIEEELETIQQDIGTANGNGQAK